MLEANETRQNLKSLVDFRKEKGGLRIGDLLVDKSGRVDRIVLAAENLIITDGFGHQEQGLPSEETEEFIVQTEPFFIGIVRRGRI